MVVNLKKKLFIVLIMSILCSGVSFAENFGMQLLKNSEVELGCPCAIVTGDGFKFAKLNVGAEVRIETDLFTTKNNFFTLGLCTTYDINWYVIKREEIRKFYTHCFLEGFTLKFALPKDFLIAADIGCGLGISKVNALSIEGKKIDNYFNSFVIGTTVVLSHNLFNIKKCSVNWNAGIETRIFVEKDSCFQTFGIVAGLTLKAR